MFWNPHGKSIWPRYVRDFMDVYGRDDYEKKTRLLAGVAEPTLLAVRASMVPRCPAEEGSIFGEMIAVVAVSAIAFILILAFYGWG